MNRGGDARDGASPTRFTRACARRRDYLFGEDFTRSDAENAVVLGFVELSRTNPAIAEVLVAAL